MSTRDVCAPQTHSLGRSKKASALRRALVPRLFLLLQFARFRDGKKFIEAMQPRKVIAFRAIQKTLLPHVNVEKSQQWPKRQVLRKGFQFSALIDGLTADFS